MNAPDLKLVEDNASPRAAGVSRFHESARAQVAGAATYIDDIPEVRGTLHAAPVCSPVAHGVLKGLDASAALAVPGVVLGIGYLRTFYDIEVPFMEGQSLATFWLVLVIALAVRRLPYALRACTAALQQVSASLEEAAENLGAGKLRTVLRIVVPLMSGGIMAGFITSFATAAVELSATMMLVQSTEDAPLAYGLYVFMQSAAGRGPGAALGVIAVLLVAGCTFISHLIIERGKAGRAAAPDSH